MPAPVRDKRYQDRVIELDHVTTYAFAQYDDGTYGFWAAGKAGWFEFQSPSNSYKNTNTKMTEAMAIFYMLADKLRKSQQRKSGYMAKDFITTAKSAFRNVS